MEDTVLEIPLDVIKASSGFSLDIGGSMAKLIYRSKKDFCNGVPKDKERAAKGLGIIRQRLIAREQIDDVLNFIKDNCDMTTDASGDCRIYSAGLGGNKYKAKIEEVLNVKLENMNEMDCFATASHLLLKMKSAAEVFTPLNKKGIQDAEKKMKTYRAFKAGIEQSANGKIAMQDTIKDYDREKDARFPYILAMCGSGFGFFKVNEDGSYVILEMTTIGGRFFLGLTSFLTGITHFPEIVHAIEESDGKTVDTCGSDLVDHTEGKKADVYSSIEEDFRAFPFEKGLTPEKREKATKGDLIHSLLETVCENIAALGHHVAQKENIQRIYFCGNFVTMPKAQQFITTMLQTKKYWGKTQVNFEFISNGGFLGALGAFIEAYAVQKKK